LSWRKEQAIEYKAKARRYGNEVEFTLSADSPKEAFEKARTEAAKIFGYEREGDEPTVHVKEIQEKE
jgi:histidyl-tRNA synthetase